MNLIEAKTAIAVYCGFEIADGNGGVSKRSYSTIRDCDFALSLLSRSGHKKVGFYFYIGNNLENSERVYGPWLQSKLREYGNNHNNCFQSGFDEISNRSSKTEGHVADFYYDLDWSSWNSLPDEEREKVKNLFENLKSFNAEIGSIRDRGNEVMQFNNGNRDVVDAYIAKRKGIGSGRITNSETETTDMIKEIEKLLKANHQIILTGAPGTGKTYLAKEIACSLTGHQNWSEAVTSGHVKFCQFHPSYSYADFVEGLRPVQDSVTGNVGFVRKDGAFKSFCKRALRKCTGNFESAYEKLCDELDEKHSSDNPLELQGERENRYGVSLNSRGNLTLHTGTDLKAHGVLTADKLRMYHENTPPEDRSWEGYFRGVLSYLGRRFGLTEDTPDQEDQKFVFVIDEINRGDLSKIFGELFFSIDPGYRGKAGITDTQYQNMVSQGDEYENGFYVPENVYIIGTMNDIDRSVESMDFAIRRRFTWYEVTADARKDMLNDIQDDDLRKKAMASMQNINKLIATADSDLELGAAYQIGPAYFLKLDSMPGDDNEEKFDALWKLHIEPLLKEYLRGQTEISEKIEKLKEAYNNDNSQRQ